MANLNLPDIPDFNNNYRYDAKNNTFMRSNGKGGFSAIDMDNIFNDENFDYSGWEWDGQGDGKKGIGILGLGPKVWTDEAIKSRNEYALDWLQQNEANRLNARGYGDRFSGAFQPGAEFGSGNWDDDETRWLFDAGFNPYATGTNWVNQYGLDTFTGMGITPGQGEVGYDDYMSTQEPAAAVDPVTGGIDRFHDASGNLVSGVRNGPDGLYIKDGDVYAEGRGWYTEQTPEQLQTARDAAIADRDAELAARLEWAKAMGAASGGAGGGEGGGVDMGQIMELMNMMFSRFAQQQGGQTQNYGYPGQSFGGSQWLMGPAGGYYDRPNAFNY